MRIEHLESDGWHRLTMGLPFQCLCECPGPPPPTFTTAPIVRAGGMAVTIDWDARNVATCEQPYDCAMHGWPGVGVISETVAVPLAVDAGHYRVTLAVVDSVPSGCTTGADGAIQCDPRPGPGGGIGTYDLCMTSRTVTAEFDVPMAGDVTVPVVIP
jgi:hypothetical protein